MKISADLPLNLAIELYYEKHHALREGNLQKLIIMKQDHPQIFNENVDKEIRGIINYAKEFEKSARYHELHKTSLKEQIAETITDESDEY